LFAAAFSAGTKTRRKKNPKQSTHLVRQRVSGQRNRWREMTNLWPLFRKTGGHFSIQKDGGGGSQAPPNEPPAAFLAAFL
jgi:hypothetical protein